VIRLYHCMSARSFRPLWALEETDTPYELVMLPFPPRMFAKEYLNQNPLGTIPLLVDGDVRMTESAAICQYIASRDPQRRLDIEPGDPAYPAYLNYLHHGEATLTFPQAVVLRYSRFEPQARRVPQVAEDYGKWFVARLRGLDAPLSRQPYLCGDRFTAADISVGYALLLATHVGLDGRFSESVRAYFERLRQRPAFQRSLAAQERAALAQGVDARAFPDPFGE
jgi:glutathione S-transferase